jgi:hypothetical protein
VARRPGGPTVPIIFSVDHERKLVTALAVGPIGYADIERHLRQERQWKGLSYPEFMDARGAGLNLAPVDVRHIVELLRRLGHEAKLGPTAVLVDNDFAFGVLRMLDSLVEDCCRIHPFRDEAEAFAWLAEQERADAAAN